MASRIGVIGAAVVEEASPSSTLRLHD